MVVVSHLFLFYGKISGADVTWYESHLPLFGTIYFPIAPFSVALVLVSFFMKKACCAIQRSYSNDCPSNQIQHLSAPPRRKIITLFVLLV